MRRVTVGLLVLASGVSACANVGSSSGSGNATLDDVTLIRASELGDAYPAALGQGLLVVDHGCLAMTTEGSPPGFILWPPTFDLRRGGAGIEVVDGEDNLVAGIGEPVQLGGGWMHLGPAQDLTGRGVPPACRVTGERYFIASPEVLWGFDGITLLRHRADLTAGDQALAVGRLGERNGCVALLDAEGEGPYLVWPRRYIFVGGSHFEIHDAADAPVATRGDRIHVAGSMAAIDDPRSLIGGIPDACQESGDDYWYVGEVEVEG